MNGKGIARTKKYIGTSGNAVLNWNPKQKMLEINVSGNAYDKSIYLDDTQTKSLFILLESVFRKRVGG